MGKIVGEVFEDYVQNQITVRQNKLGNTTYDDDLLTYTTSKDSWLRLSSAVNVSQDKLSELPNIPSSITPENGLAESYVLFGGANNITKSSKPKGGLINTYTDSMLANASYGFDSTATYGLTPLPGITSFNIKPKNNGSIVEGEIKIKCYNIQQFDHIESLYLRLGYTLLLEWGHTIYYTNNGTLETQITDNTDSVLRQFIKGEKGTDPDPQSHILKEISKAREKASGNYDAILGRVTNFDWSVTPTGEYEISISVISPGSVIESLSISTVLPNKRKEEGDTKGEDNTGIVDPIESTTIGSILASFKKLLSADGVSTNKVYTTDLGDLFDVGSESENGNNFEYFYLRESLTNDNINISANFDVKGFTDPKNQSTIPTREIVAIEPKSFDSKSDDSDSDRVFYIKLGALLRIIQNFLLLYNTNEIDTPPIISIDWNYDDNKCFIPLTNLFSSAPSICAIPSRWKNSFEQKGLVYGTNTKKISFTALNNVLGKDWFGKNEYEYNFMHIYLAIDNLYSLLRNNINSEGDLALIDFLTAICTGINSSLSNQTEFSPFVDADTNILHIINKRNSDPILEERPTPSKFQIGYLHNNGSEGLAGIKVGSFVKNVSIKSTIPPNFATQISIGAQANNENAPSTNSQPFTNWNKGYTDRIALKKNYPQPLTSASQAERDSKADALENTTYNANEAAYLYSNFIYDESFTKLSTDVNEYFKTDAEDKISKNPEFTTPILIPISLSLTLDGLSGMKIFQKYTITDKFLPKSYRDNIEFIIKGINHTIDSNGWITNLEGQFMPKSKPSSPPNGNLASTKTTPKTEALNKISNESTGKTPNADALRLVLDVLGYKEKGKEISNGGDISIELANYAIAVLTEIKTQYPNVNVRVTGGNDKYHQTLSYNSAHKKGDGLDFVVSPSDPTDRKSVV